MDCCEIGSTPSFRVETATPLRLWVCRTHFASSRAAWIASCSCFPGLRRSLPRRPPDAGPRGVEPPAVPPHEAAPFLERGVAALVGEDRAEVDPALVALAAGREDLETVEARAPAEV